MEIEKIRAQLSKTLAEKQVNEEKLNNKIQEKRDAIKEWEKNIKKMHKEIKHNEMMQQKERYELLSKIKDLKSRLGDQRKQMKEQ